MQNLRILRAKENISQKEFAERCGISESSISLYESGQRKPNADVLLKISKEFNVTIDWLLESGDTNEIKHICE